MAKAISPIPSREEKTHRMIKLIANEVKRQIEEERNMDDITTALVKKREKKKGQTQDGRPAQSGSMYFEKTEYGVPIKKYCVTYCPDCGKKIGCTREELEEFARNTPGIIEDFLSRLIRTKVIFPK